MVDQGRSLYSQEFFRNISDSANRSSGVVLPVVFEILGRTPSSVLDVGCGTGEWLAAVSRLGVKDFIGVDGAYVPEDQLAFDKQHFVSADLTRPLDVGRSFDLAMSLEVAEHLTPNAAETIVASLCNHADIILFSAAIPGQGGEHHVNERPVSYWAGLFGARGYEAFDLVRPAVWQDDAVMFYYRQNTLLYARGAAADQLKSRTTHAPLDIVHPAQLQYWHELGASEALPFFTSAVRRTVKKRLARLTHAS